MPVNTWKTQNQSYGAHAQSKSTPKQRIGASTHGFLVAQDQTGFLHHQQNIAQRSRHGLFTQPLGLGPGDVYVEPKRNTSSHLAASGPKNMTVNVRLQEKVGPELFQKMGSTAIGDLYRDKFRDKNLYDKEKRELTIHQAAFNAGGKQKLVKHSQFEHQKEFVDKNYETRAPDGTVIVQPKGVFASSISNGKVNPLGQLFGAYPYVGENYDDPSQKAKRQNLEHKAKIKGPFMGATKQNATFTPDHAVYKAPTSEPYNPPSDNDVRGKPGNWNYNNPNKTGYNGTFEKFPQYIEEGERPNKTFGNEPIWKPNFNGTSKGLGETLHRPCPPQSHMVLNDVRRVQPSVVQTNLRSSNY